MGQGGPRFARSAASHRPLERPLRARRACCAWGPPAAAPSRRSRRPQAPSCREVPSLTRAMAAAAAPPSVDYAEVEVHAASGALIGSAPVACRSEHVIFQDLFDAVTAWFSSRGKALPPHDTVEPARVRRRDKKKTQCAMFMPVKAGRDSLYDALRGSYVCFTLSCRQRA